MLIYINLHLYVERILTYLIFFFVYVYSYYISYMKEKSLMCKNNTIILKTIKKKFQIKSNQ